MTALTHFVMTVAFCNKISYFVMTAEFCNKRRDVFCNKCFVTSYNKTVVFYNKKPDEFCYKILSYCVIK